jgi:hypothetical protein
MAVKEDDVASTGCDRERVLLAAIGTGRWAAGCDEELHAHVAVCAECSEVAEAAAALFEERRGALADGEIPHSGLVWWRIQMRARRDAQRAAARTLSLAHAAALCGAFGVALALLGAEIFSDWGGSLPALASAMRAGALGLSSLLWGAPLLLALGAWVALAPVAVWLAVGED